MKQIHRLSPLFKNKSNFILNSGVPACINCKHFNVIDDKPVCKLFGVYDMINGKTSHLDANKCRTDTTLCDTSGIFFQPNMSNILAKYI